MVQEYMATQPKTFYFLVELGNLLTTGLNALQSRRTGYVYSVIMLAKLIIEVTIMLFEGSVKGTRPAFSQQLRPTIVTFQQ